MFKLWSNSVLASEIAEFLGKKLFGPDIAVYGPRNIDDLSDNCLICLSGGQAGDWSLINEREEVLVLSSKAPKKTVRCSTIITANPRIDFVHVIEQFFLQKIVPGIHPTAVIEKGAKIGEGAAVLANCHISSEVEVGAHTVIQQNAVISGRVKIGKHCVIKANSVIGSDVFNFVQGETEWEHFPQIGRIVIGDHVWIGAGTTVEKGAFSDTVIGEGVKIDDLVQIGHDAVIGDHSMIAAGSVLCGQVKIGKHCWVAPQASILQKRTVGDKAVVGLGAVVIENVKAGTVVVGNPAKVIKNTRKPVFPM
ncbi:MAG: hypothetical protein WC352_07200 [Candidatus Omnitrophota bacterium]|jgi:UDP-3-O-[3-hydroxymyristoyl] glucosamine N-acyltransferase